VNAGRLHAVLESIKQDYEKNGVVGKLQATVNALSTSINSTTEANANVFREALADLYAALDQSPSISAAPSQLEILQEIGGADKTGLGLRERIQSTLDANNVTPANALAELQKILEGVTHFMEVVVKTVEGFDALKIPYDELEPGETEIGVQVPWPVIHSNLEGFQKELHEFDKALRIFGEVAEDNPQSPKIRAVGSSTLQVFIQSTPAIAVCVAAALERLCALYKQILEIKLLKKQLREKSLPDKVTASVEEHQQQLADKGIEKIANDLIREFSKKRDKQRQNELRNGMRAALRFLAAQIDAGVDMEVRSEPPRAKDVAEGEGENIKSAKTKIALEKARKTVVRIKRAGVAMRALKRAGEPILALKQPPKRKEKKNDKNNAT
jgi:hypothetical protein